MRQLETIRRDIDHRGDMAGMDEFPERALAMVTSPEVLETEPLTSPGIRTRPV
jgi:hypothetical protein